MQYPLKLIPVSIPIIAFAVLYLVIILFKKYHSLKRRRSPFTGDFMRSPGEFLRYKIEELNDEITMNLMTLIIGPVMFYSIFITQVHFGKISNPVFMGMLLGLLSLILMAYFLVKTIRLMNTRRHYRLGYDAEISVAQELNRLMLSGYHVYHDVPGKGFNIDHVVVGPAGVFAVETKGRLKPTTSNRASDARVVYDGKKLQFPNWVETKPLEQAQRQAKGLSNWLSSAVGEPVNVRPVLALPGWFVERTASEGIPVVNPKGFKGLLKPSGGSFLGEAKIKRIVHQLEQRCRNVQSMTAEVLGENRTGL